MFMNYDSNCDNECDIDAVKPVWNFVKMQLNKMDEKYHNNVIMRNKANGQKGGRPKTQTNIKNPVGYLETQKTLKDKDKDKDKNKDKDNDNVKDNINNTICKSFKQFCFEEFESEVKQIASDNKIHPDHVSDFLDYWTEKDVTGKMGFQNQKTWETSKRLKRWVRSSKKQLPEYVWPGKSWDEMTFEERDKNKHIATPEQLKAHNSDNRNWF